MSTKETTALQAKAGYKFNGTPSEWPKCKSKIKTYCMLDLKIHDMLSMQPEDAQNFNQTKKQKNAKLFNTIRTFTESHSENIAQSIVDETNGIALWHALCERYEAEALNAYQDVEKTFTNFKIKKNQNGLDYLYECKAVHKQLTDLADIINARDRKEHGDPNRPPKQMAPSQSVLVKRVLDGLQHKQADPKFRTFVTSYKIAKPVTDRTFDDIMVNLREFTSVFDQTASTNTPLSESTILAMVAEIMKKNQQHLMQAHRAGMQPTPTAGTKTECKVCHGYGHLSEQCVNNQNARCDSCRGYGHTSKVCPNNKIEDQFRGAGYGSTDAGKHEKKYHADDVRNNNNRGNNQQRVNNLSKLCYQWRDGRCRFGNNCRYGHFGEGGSSGGGNYGGGSDRRDNRDNRDNRGDRSDRGGGRGDRTKKRRFDNKWKVESKKRMKQLEETMNANFTRLSAQIADNQLAERIPVPRTPTGLTFGMASDVSQNNTPQ